MALRLQILLAHFKDLLIKAVMILAEALIYAAGGSVDTDSLTATSGDVVSPLKFYGSGSEEIQQGSIVNRGELNKVLGINETYVVPAGYYSGGKVSQNIPVLGTQRVTPTSKTQTLYTQGRYMGGDIIQNAIPNLVPENIKKGEYVGGVGPGTWEGYIVEDPATFYYKGTFGPGQSITAFKYSSTSNINIPQYGKKNMTFWGNTDARERYYALVFDGAIDITNKSKLTIEGTYYRNSVGTTTNMVIDTSGYTMKASAASDTYNGLDTSKRIFLNQYRPPTAQGEYTYKIEIDLSAYSRSVYLYILISMSRDDDYVTIDSVKFT